MNIALIIKDKFKLMLWLGFICLFLPLNANAVSIVPDKVIFGVYPVAVWDMNPITNSFDISFYAWWRGEKNNYDLTRDMEIINAHDFNFKKGNTQVTEDGQSYYSVVHYYAKIHQHWDTKYFPFSHQFLKVKLETNDDVNSTILIPDYQRSHLHPDFKISGWDVIGFKLEKSTTKYNTDFGDDTAARSSYDRLTFVIEIKHHGFRLYFSYFIGYFMAGLLAFLLFFISRFPFPARATVFMSAVISFISNKYTIDQKIPINSVFSLSDIIETATFAILFIVVMTTIIAELIIKDELKRDRVSNYIGYVSILLYTGVIIFYTYQAIIS